MRRFREGQALLVDEVLVEGRRVQLGAPVRGVVCRVIRGSSGGAWVNLERRIELPRGVHPFDDPPRGRWVLVPKSGSRGDREAGK